MTTKFKFGRLGITEDPRGAQVAWTLKGRHYLADVVGVYRDERLGATFLKVRFFNGEAAPDVAATFVEVLGWSAAAAHRAHMASTV